MRHVSTAINFTSCGSFGQRCSSVHQSALHSEIVFLISKSILKWSFFLQEVNRIIEFYRMKKIKFMQLDQFIMDILFVGGGAFFKLKSMQLDHFVMEILFVGKLFWEGGTGRMSTNW